MQTNEYEEIEYYYQKRYILNVFELLTFKKMRKWMESTLYWDTKGHYEICAFTVSQEPQGKKRKNSCI